MQAALRGQQEKEETFAIEIQPFGQKSDEKSAVPEGTASLTGRKCRTVKDICPSDKFTMAYKG